MIDMTGMEKEHEDWIRHAAFDQVRKYYRGNKDVSLIDIMREAATVADFFMDARNEKKPSAEVIQLKLVQKENGITEDALMRFHRRYQADNVEAMTDEQWGKWVDALPRDEFMAMISLKDEPEATA